MQQALRSSRPDGGDRHCARNVRAPKNTPSDVVERLNKEIAVALADSKIKARLADVGSVPIPMSSGNYGKLIADETEKWAKVIRAANIKSE